jgi:acyl carrier protein
LIQRLKQTHPASRIRLLTSFLQDELQVLSGREQAPDIDELILDADVDSLMIVEFRDRLQAQVGAQLLLPATIVFDHPKISDLAAHLLSSLEQDEAKASGAEPAPESRPDSTSKLGAQRVTQQIEDMSEQQAMEALLREVND